MSTHTTGPWEANGDTVYAKDSGMRVCDVRGWGYLTGKGVGALGLPDDQAFGIQLANARLIAAAPDLLDALRNLLDEAEDVFVCMTDATGIDRHNYPSAFKAARAALAKAENG